MTKLYGFSEKTLERNFKHSLGLKPNEFSDIVRFYTIFKLIRTKKHIDWAETAQTFGYYDQSHLINDFKKFVPVPPNTLLDKINEYVLYINRIYTFAERGKQ